MKLAVLLCGLIGSLAAGCAGQVDLFDPGGLSAEPPTSYSDREWATVLRENVKNDLVDYNHLREHAEPLEHYLDLLAAVGPESTPNLFASRDARLAYYVNAYNAGVLAAVLYEKVPSTMHDVTGRRLDHGYRLLIDRKPRTPGELREAARANGAGDARLELWLCDAAKGSPPLTDRPLRADTLDEDLRDVARRAMSNHNLVSVDHEHGRLNVALVILERRADFLDFHRRQTGAGSTTLLSALLHLADGVRREWLNTAVGYKEGVVPFDRSLNLWTAELSTSP